MADINSIDINKAAVLLASDEAVSFYKTAGNAELKDACCFAAIFLLDFSNKPCPFCGGMPKLDKKFISKHNEDVQIYCYACKICGARTKYYDDSISAAQAWGRRADNG